MFVHALDGRIRATTARAFHDKLVATQQASEAIKIEANAWNSLQRYTSGGGHLFALENEKGIFTMQVRGHRVLPVWLELQEVNPERFGERHSVSRIDFRELQNLLRRMKAANISFVATSTEKDAERLVPIDQLLNHVNQTVTSVDDSEMGKMFRDGIECDQP